MNAMAGIVMALMALAMLAPTTAALLGYRKMQGERARLLYLPAAGALALALLNISIWFNPYGREISSSLPAFAVLPAAALLLAMSLLRLPELARMWPQERPWLLGLGAAHILLGGLLWWAQALTFYLLAGFSGVALLAWLASTRLKLAGLLTLTILGGAAQVVLGGGWFALGPQSPGWLETALNILRGISLPLSIFLPAALLYAVLRGPGAPDRVRVGVAGGAAVILALCLASGVFWDGVYSAVRERAYEDHLPFVHFLLSLAAGGALALALPRRWWVGPAYMLVVTGSCVAALSLGWGVSAERLTEQRAARLDAAIRSYAAEQGGYPRQLAQLAPRYLLYAAPPVITQDGGWCYQGDAQGYRLGYMGGTFSYFSSSYQVEVYAQAGTAPQADWSCDEVLRQMEAGEMY